MHDLPDLRTVNVNDDLRIAILNLLEIAQIIVGKSWSFFTSKGSVGKVQRPGFAKLPIVATWQELQMLNFVL
jgi:hypothetical protein